MVAKHGNGGAVEVIACTQADSIAAERSTTMMLHWINLKVTSKINGRVSKVSWLLHNVQQGSLSYHLSDLNVNMNARCTTEQKVYGLDNSYTPRHAIVYFNQCQHDPLG